LPCSERRETLKKKEVRVMRHVLMVAMAVALMLTGAVLLVTGSTSALPFAAITVGISLTVIDFRRRGPAQ
jgi:hypothetical protein